MQNLIELVKEQSELVERENWKYYYQADNYKFNNVFLANWYEQEHNSWATFVAQPLGKIKQKLKNENFNPTVDYDVEYLKKLREENDYLQLFFSGGADSLTTLSKAIDNDIYIDELVSVATGDNLNLPENYEITHGAIPVAKKYSGKYGKFTIKQTTFKEYEKIYQDPYSLFKCPDVGAQFPIFRRMWWTNWEPINGKRIISNDKPQLLYYKNRWYTVFLDAAINGTYGIDKDCEFIKFEADNIFSTIKDSLDYRNYLLENNQFNGKDFQFYKLSNYDDNTIINRIEPDNKEIFFSKEAHIKKSWNQKDSYSLCQAINQYEINLLTGYFKSLENILNVYPEYKYQDYTLAPMKFAWFIDIDSLEAYSQEELIPNGFEL